MISLAYLSEALDYDPETGILTWKKSRPRHHFKSDRAHSVHIARDGGKVAGTVSKGGYINIGLDGTKYLANRIAYAIHHEIEPADLPDRIDHKDGDTLNNRALNLRPATHNQNMHNSKIPASNTSGYKGVSWHKTNKKWAANIKVNGRKIHVGYFLTPEAAFEARNSAADTLHGDFARAA